MGRLIAALAALVGWSCFATVLAMGTVAGYAVIKGYVTPEKMEKIVAIAHGVEMIPREEAERAARQKTAGERPSLEAVELERAAMTVNLEMRENSVNGTVSELKKLQRALEEEKDRFDKYAGAFRSDLQSRRTKAIEDGQREFDAIVESMKPRQAKEQLLLKVKENKMDVVIATMKNLEDAKRAKVLAEFKTSEDQEVLARILEGIRNPGEDAASRALKALDEAGQAN